MSTLIELPAVYKIDKKEGRNSVRQLLHSPHKVKVEKIESYSKGKLSGYILSISDLSGSKIFITRSLRYPKRFGRVININKNTKISEINSYNSVWLKHPNMTRLLGINRHIAYQKKIINSWQNSFFYKEEDVNRNVSGLRSPQIGALHAIKAHWTISSKLATVVMPTATGKTETMLSILVLQQCKRVMVIVPTDPLRTQIADKFIKLGILRNIGAVSKSVLNPVVGVLRQRPKTQKEVDDFFQKCNVIVTTMNIAGQCLPKIQERMAKHCPYLFIDEAHHAPAKRWSKFINKFRENKILQFTATPFRNDNKLIGGEIIYKYPLKLAQENGYFKPINFKPVREFDYLKADQVIAEAAVDQLHQDPSTHILMARTDSVKRAEEVYTIYKNYSEFNPVRIHSRLSTRERERTRKKILNKETRIIVCVDMLGEGFDLPELKIVAFHDIRKSLPITLQIVGRFIRSRPDLGEATSIANIADVDVRDEIKKFYAQGSDWNVLLEQSSEGIIEQQIELQDFIDGFDDFLDKIPLQNLQPAMSMVAYKTRCKNWNPENFKEGIQGVNSLERIIHAINSTNNTLIIVTAKKVPVKWARIKEIYNWDWELYILYWDEVNRLLFIHNSSNTGYFKGLAEAVAEEVELIRGASVFRCFAGINRLRLHNVGLIELLGKLIRYIMRSGADVEAGLTEAQKRNVFKSNFFGAGYESGEKTTVGCSYKGRIWSHRVANIKDFTKWCTHIGNKILNENIDPDNVLKGTLIPEAIFVRPKVMPVGIEWPEEIYKRSENSFIFIFGEGIEVPLFLTSIQLENPNIDGELKFSVSSLNHKIEFVVKLFRKNNSKDYSYSAIGNKDIKVRYRNQITLLKEFFYKFSPVIIFADGSLLEGNSYVKLKHKPVPFSVDKIKVWNWNGINIRKESQGINKDRDSIQYKVIQELKNKDYDIIFNDDGSGEAADVVAIKKSEKEKIIIEFYHCKFSREDTPGSRIDDLYTVCGQAQKSINWRNEPELKKLFHHLLRREPMRLGDQELSRFEKGDEQELTTIMEMCQILPKELKIYIVQPGLSKKRISQAQLELLGVTENYLMETYQIPFRIIANE